MRAAQLSRCAALLLLLGAALATVPGRPTVMDVRAGWNRRADVSVASTSQAGQQESYGYENYGVEEKEICLMEVHKRSCHTHKVDGGCGGRTTTDEDCDRVHSFWTSDLACCKDKHDNYNYGHGSGSVGDQLWGGAHGAIGSCDWTAHWVDDNEDLEVTDKIYRLGSATAVCYFGADSQACGGPFCERMVMSLEGNIYTVSDVYSYWGETKNAAGTCEDGFIDEFRMNADSREAPTAAKEAPKAATKPAAASIASDASPKYYHDEGHYENRAVYGGTALVINGIVTSMAGPRREKWDSGVFEFVASYTQENSDPIATALDSNTPWVRDKAYKFTFFKQSSY